ncbi:MAG: hypothetical protein NTX25_03975, partial [Proteobacteria bacterium]|nr:hypothetical protein [Pseudomonadota bacterium]
MLPTRFDPGFLKPIEKDDSLVAPIIHDINACNEDRAKQCLTMLSRSVSNYQQALIGFDENRDNLAEAGS